MVHTRQLLVAIALIATCLYSSGLADETPAKKKTFRTAKTGGEIQKLPTPASLLKEDTLDGWGYFLVKKEGSDKTPKMSDVWSIEKGILTCKGIPMGYLSTNEKYQNFTLTFQWRWPNGVEPTNSGVFVRVTGKDQALPHCVEVQLCHKKAGDLIGFHGIPLKSPGKDAADRLVKKESPLGGAVSILAKTRDAELPPGEWNHGKILVHGQTITVWINGKQVNRATDLPVTAGKIALQSEGGIIEFRTVKIDKKD